MSSSVKPGYSVTASVGSDDVTAHVILDKKNNSIHLHFYGNIFGRVQKPILFKSSEAKFPDGGEVEVVKQIFIGEFKDKKVQVESVVAEKDPVTHRTRPPQRTIIRFSY